MFREMYHVLYLCLGSTLAFLTAPELDNEWQLFQLKFNRNYNHNEELLRRLIWEDNVRQIRKHNMAADRGESSYRMGVNRFTDMSFGEVQKFMMGHKKMTSSSGSTFLRPSNVVVPDEVDWRKKGLVTSVKNQGQCGSCWAFSTVGSLEGQHAKSTGKLESLSAQNLVDCSSGYGNNGCDGGWVEKAFDYIKNNGGIDTESSYPYNGEPEQPCTFKTSGVGARISGYTAIPEGSEDDLQSAVASVGPISVCIDATSNLQHYSSGIFDDQTCSSIRTNHCVLAVGYGTQGDDDYWLVKNSWGTSWGMDGYVLMSRNKDNQCAIASDALYPLLKQNA